MGIFTHGRAARQEAVPSLVTARKHDLADEDIEHAMTATAIARCVSSRLPAGGYAGRPSRVSCERALLPASAGWRASASSSARSGEASTSAAICAPRRRAASL